jgi:hypothetical protein
MHTRIRKPLAERRRPRPANPGLAHPIRAHAAIRLEVQLRATSRETIDTGRCSCCPIAVSE